MLTWTLMMAKHSPVIADQYIENNSPDKLIEMRLLTPEEFEKLSENDGTSILWSDNWWVPMTWNMLLVNNEMNANGHLPRYQIYMVRALVGGGLGGLKNPKFISVAAPEIFLALYIVKSFCSNFVIISNLK